MSLNINIHFGRTCMKSVRHSARLTTPRASVTCQPCCGPVVPLWRFSRRLIPDAISLVLGKDHNVQNYYSILFFCLFENLRVSNKNDSLIKQIQNHTRIMTHILTYLVPHKFVLWFPYESPPATYFAATVCMAYQQKTHTRRWWLESMPSLVSAKLRQGISIRKSTMFNF